MVRPLFACARALAACLLLPFALAAVAHAQAPNLVVAPVDAAVRAQLRGHLPAWARAEADSGPVAPDLRLENLSVMLRRSPASQQAFDQWTHDQQDAGSPYYHHWLTADEIGERFGASQHDLDAISAWLASQGLEVHGVSRSRMWINFSGTAAQVGAALGTSFHSYGSLPNGNARISVATEPTVPAALLPAISSFAGLSTFDVEPQSSHHLVPMSGISPKNSDCSSTPCNHYVMPLDFAKIYDVQNTSSSTNGSGQIIAIVGRSRVYTPDITTFQTQSAVTFPQPNVVIPPGGIDPGPAAGPGQTPGGDQGEQTLDVTRSGSVAPGAQTLLVLSADSSTVSGIDVDEQYVIDQHSTVKANVLSMSYGTCESQADLAYAQQLDTLAQQGAAEGISIFVSAGDSGVDGCFSASAVPPATPEVTASVQCASGYVTCTGGTEFNDTTNSSAYWATSNGTGMESALRYIPEGAWNEPSGSGGAFQMASTGGGFSVYLPTPSFQAGPGVPGTQGRYTPDVSFSSSNHDGYYGCQVSDGADCVNSFDVSSGTSASAPDWAGVAALLDQATGSGQGNLNPTLYSLAQGGAAATIFHDVTVATSGVASCSVSIPSMCNNSNASPTALTGGQAGYLVTAGYDEATGLGSVDVNQLLQNWPLVALASLPSPTVSLTLSGSNLSSIIPAQFAISVVGSGATPIGTIQLLSGTNNLGVAETLSNGNATESLYLPAGSTTVTASYPGDGNYSGSVSNGVTVVVAKASITPAATLSSSTVAAGQAVSLSVVLSVPSGAIEPTGSVQFQSNGSNLGSPVTLTNGSATLAGQTFAAVGTYSITAAYSGDANYSASTSTVASLSVQDFSLSAAAISVPAGSSTGNTSTITVTGINGFAGSVALSCTIPGALAETSCAFSPTSVTASGTSTLTLTTHAPHFKAPGGSSSNRRPMLFGATGGAVFAAFALLFMLPKRRRPALFSLLVFAAASGILIGCSGGGGGGGSNVTQLPTPTVAVAVSPNPATTSQAVTMTATVSGSAGAPTGTVQFQSNGASVGSPATLNGSGVATLSNTFAAKGSYSITAAYAGDTNYSTATSAASALTVNYTDSGTPSGSYTVVVTGLATIGGVPVSHTANIAVTVQ